MTIGITGSFKWQRHSKEITRLKIHQRIMKHLRKSCKFLSLFKWSALWGRVRKLRHGNSLGVFWEIGILNIYRNFLLWNSSSTEAIKLVCQSWSVWFSSRYSLGFFEISMASIKLLSRSKSQHWIKVKAAVTSSIIVHAEDIRTTIVCLKNLKLAPLINQCYRVAYHYQSERNTFYHVKTITKIFFEEWQKIKSNCTVIPLQSLKAW